MDSLTVRSLRSCTDKLAFRNAGNLEKFIADFDAHAAISRSLACHVRGGLCFPFHVPHAAHRLSKDLDLYAYDAVDAVTGKVPDLLTEHGFTSVSTHWQSSKTRAIKHLVRFNAQFRSKFEATVSIDIDIACGLAHGLVDTVTIPAGYALLGIRTARDISALSRGSLIADKIMSLGIGTVGYESLRSTPKQIYDIGKLIQHASVEDLASMLSLYEKMTEFKLSLDSRGYTQDEVLDSIVSYLDRLGRPGASPGLDEHWGHFGMFSTSMLSKTQQARADHMERILLVLACARSLSRSLRRDAPHADEAAWLRGLVDEARSQRGPDARLAFLRKKLDLHAA
ncbi:MAG: nucleotidyl transferase AbiEii/AbiGii toxin family protein [Thaumarchaeota archaeon]|nr:nucleotidyl transferase AbiEii/AbiGii toxin family protein [Nitrososphaerota archaeon]